MTAPSTISALASTLDGLSPTERARFDRLFAVSSARGRLVLPPSMYGWVRSAFGGVEAVEHQVSVRVRNRVTGEETLFNTLRATRPLEIHDGSLSEVDLAEVLEGRQSDPFCRPLEQTPEDVFGRVYGEHCLTASNIAKIDAFHGVVIFREHHPLRFTRAQVADYLRTGVAWGERVLEVDPLARYWLLWWNALWKSGASVVHGHAQVIATQDGHYRQIEHLRQAAARYAACHQRDYFADFVDAHEALGLVRRQGTAVVLASLTPVKDHEVWIVDQALSEDLLDLVYRALTSLTDRLDVQSFNLVYERPPLGPALDDWAGFPHIVRVVDRGPLDTPMSDIGGLEMYATSGAASDPFRTIEALD